VAELLREVVEILDSVRVSVVGFESQGTALLLGEKGKDLVEDVEVPFAEALADDPALLEEVVFDGGVVYLHGFGVDAQPDELAEPA
jgi:hypothetical protein